MKPQSWLLEKGSKDPAKGPQRVYDAIWLLSGHNVFGHVWYHGPKTHTVTAPLAAAFQQAKRDLGYPTKAILPTYGMDLRGYLTGEKKLSQSYRDRIASHAAKFVWPTSPRGSLIGFPGQGTHSYSSPPNNWESDNAWDIAVPEGSKWIAVADGLIVPGVYGSLGRGGRFAGLRLHLRTADNEFYYAHGTKLIAPEGGQVKQGQLIGLSGSANGVAHLHIGMLHIVQINTFH